MYISKTQQIEDKFNASYSVYLRALYREIFVYHNSCSSLPTGLLDLPKRAEVCCLMNNVFVRRDMLVWAEKELKEDISSTFFKYGE